MAESINPHKIFSNLRNVDIENLSFFASLTVTRRNRSSTPLNNNGNSNSFTIDFNGYSENNIYTTNWTEGVENFGIRNIDIEMTASYVPKINIEFIDVRGQAVFNDANNSKYKCMFELPPPIFELTIKGYYGKPISYRLHMIKQNTRWEKGSYIIKAEFIGLTFAPLSDMMVDYLNVASFLGGNSESKTSYINFIKTTKMVMNKIENEIQTYGIDINANEEKINNLKGLKNRGEILESVKSDLDTYIQDKNFTSFYNVSIITINDIKSLVINCKNYRGSDKTDLYNNFVDSYKEFQGEVGRIVKLYDNIIPNNLSKMDFIKFSFIPATVFPKFTNEITDNDISLLKFTKIYEINIDSSFSTANKIDSLINDEQLKLEELKSELDKSKKNIILSEGDLTLKNVLGIILENAKIFYNEMKSLVSMIEGKNRQGTAGKSQDLAKYAFPEFWGDKIENNITKTLKMHPNGGDYNNWDEMVFMSRYIEAKKQSQIAINQIASMKTSIDTQNELLSLYLNDETTYYTGNKLKELIDDYLRRDVVIKTFYKDTVSLEGYDNEKLVITDVLTKNSLLADELLNIGSNKENLNNFIKSLPFYEIVTNPNVNYYKSLVTIKKETDIDFSNISVDNPWYNKPNSTFKNYPIYIDEAFKDSSNTIKNNYETNVYTKGFKSFMEDVYSKDRATLGELCELFNDNVNLLLNYNEYFPKESNTSGYLKLLWDGMNNGVNEFFNVFFPSAESLIRRKGIYIIPRFYLIYFFHFNRTDMIKYQTFYNLCEKEYNDFNRTYHFTNDFKNLQNIEDFCTHSSVAGLFDPVTLNCQTNNIYLKDEDLPSYLKSTVIKNVSISNLSNNVNAVIGNIKSNRQTANQNTSSETAINMSIEQSELKTQLYYTFKSFVDKWIYSTPLDIENMFSLDNFLTIDRGFNDIGSDIIMDLSPLYNIEYSVDTSLYTLLLNLLGKNNMNFFALPSYIEYDKGSGVLWSDTNIQEVFGTYQPTTVKSLPKFICMYVGGFSSSLDIRNDNEFGNDSGTLSECIGLDNVHSFKVEIGDGNQSFFTDVELDQQEYKETNESIILLDDITKNNGNPNRIATNSLINVYEQRSYTATVPMLGCAMIQPTMYFELNVPMFRGVYLILEVRHNLTPNKMSTTFKGVRVPKVSKPYVNEMRITTYDNNFISYDSYEKSIGGTYFIGSGLKSNASATNYERAMLDMLAWAEGTSVDSKSKYLGYDVYGNNKLLPNWNPNDPPFFPSAEITGLESSASGRYQIIRRYWNENGFEGKPFSITNQDEYALKAIRGQFKRYGKLDLKNATQTNFIEYLDALAPLWASLPFYNIKNIFSAEMLKKYKAWEKGKSLYGLGGDGMNTTGRNQIQAKNTVNGLWEVYRNSLKISEGLSINYENIDAKNRDFLTKLHPVAQARFANFIRDADNNGYKIIISSGFRNYLPKDAGYEPATKSLHMVGLALDINFIYKGIQYKQANSANDWKSTGILNISDRNGLFWGGLWNNPDVVHFEVMDINNERFSGTNLNDFMNKNNLKNLNGYSYASLSKISKSGNV